MISIIEKNCTGLYEVTIKEDNGAVVFHVNNVTFKRAVILTEELLEDENGRD